MKTNCRLLIAVMVTGMYCFASADEPPIEPFKAAWNVRDHIPLERFTIQSHRGAGELAPENTLEAFELGWKLGIIPEADVRTTKDGVIVAFHDANFSRIVRGIAPEMAMRGVGDVTFEELANEVRESGVASQVLLATSKHSLIQHWKQLLPDSGTLLWIPGTEADKRAAFAAARQTDFDGITQLQIHVRMPGDAKDVKPGEPFSPSRGLAEVSSELAARGILFQTLPYGASDATTYHQLLDAGLASFSTDYPTVTLKAVRDYYAVDDADVTTQRQETSKAE